VPIADPAASRDAALTLRRVEREQHLLELLARSDRRHTAAELAAGLGVTARTVERDLERLRQTGIPLDGRPGRGGGVRLAVGRQRRQVILSVTEIVALLASLTALGPTATPAAASATRTLVGALVGSPEPAEPAEAVAPTRRRLR
jgi:predicted DNA-binding transcriptional regulator YafY